MIGVDTDTLWPPHQQQEICKKFSANGVPCHLEMLASIQGHDCFLVDYKRCNPAVGNYLKNLD